MSAKLKTNVLFVIKVLLALAFGTAGGAKLAGAEMMVQTFEAIGAGQWFRYLTGLIELGSSILLWVPGFQFIAASLLTCTMVCVVLAHLFVLGPSAIPALVLGALSCVVAVASQTINLSTQSTGETR